MRDEERYAAHYIYIHKPKNYILDVAVVLGDNLGLLARAISASLGDKNLLVQRSCLELLVVNFPLKNKYVKLQKNMRNGLIIIFFKILILQCL